MTAADPPEPDPPAELPAELAGLTTDEERDRFLAAHPQLVSRDGLRRIIAEVVRLLRVDLERGARLAATACRLAERLDDDACRGLARRAVANVHLFQRDYAAALAEYEAALELFAAAGDEAEAAITQSSAVVCLSHIGRYEQAQEWADAARRTFEADGDELRLARLEFNVGHLLSRRDRFHEALSHFRSAQRLLERVGTPHDLAIAIRNVAVCYQMMNDFPASMAEYERARAYGKAQNLPLLVLEVEYNIAYLYYLQGEYTRALHLFEVARRQAEEHGDRYHRALCDLDLAEIYLELNMVEEAADLARSGYEGFIDLGMAYEAAKTLVSQAIAAGRLGQPEIAIEILERARKLFEGERNEVWIALIDLWCASVLFSEGRLIEATRLAEAALGAFKSARLPTKTALCEVTLARLAIASGKPQNALDYCAAALDTLRDVGLPALEFQVHLVAGQASEAEGDVEAAVAAYERSHETLEQLRSQLNTEELKIAFLEDKLVLYESLVTLHLSHGNPDEAEAVAFDWIEKAKSRSLADLLSFGAHALPSTTGRGREVDEMRRLRDEINWHYRQIEQEELTGQERSGERIGALRSQARQREQQVLQHLRRLQTDDADFRSLQDSITADLDTVRSVLPAGAQLLEYYIARDTIYACVVDRERLEIEAVAPATRVRELHHQLQLQLSKFRLGAEYLERFGKILARSTLGFLQKLHTELVAPVASLLTREELIVVPHDFLHYLPFQALHDGDRYMIDHHPISYAPSATVLHLCSIRGGQPADKALVLGVADDRAPLIRDEARAVAEALPNATLLEGEQATRRQLERLGRDCRWVHIATHGLYRRDNPMFSAIQLGDARLSLLDLYSLELEAELAVLSGCGTGLSAVRGGDELVGLARGFLYAGARSVLVTLWDVNDESTAAYMRLFYRHLKEDPRPARALRRAVLELREQHAHPYYWAPFVVIGRPDGAPAMAAAVGS